MLRPFLVSDQASLKRRKTITSLTPFPILTIADHPTIVLLALTALRTLHPFLPPSEQAHLASIFPRALATSRRRGELPADENSRLKFWAGWLVLSLEAGT